MGDVRQEIHTNCNVVADVDFGKGPVQIRCTKVGPHDDHKCEVRITTPEMPLIEHRNVFEGEDERSTS